MYDSAIKLITESKTTDVYGDQVVTRSEKLVFADVRSVGQSEFYQAQALGLRPEIKFVIADYLDYSGQKKIVFRDFNEETENEYTVIRTYRTGNELEIVCRRGVDE